MRPQRVFDARRQAMLGEISKVALRQVENEAIADVVKKQEAVGLQGITDGEFRRAYFHRDFLQQLNGVTVTGMIAASSDANVGSNC